MKRYPIPILVIFVLVLGLSGCSATGTTKPVPTKTDVPTITQDEACALVYNYLDNKATSIATLGVRMPLLSSVDTDRLG